MGPTDSDHSATVGDTAEKDTTRARGAAHSKSTQAHAWISDINDSDKPGSGICTDIYTILEIIRFKAISDPSISLRFAQHEFGTAAREVAQ